MHSVYVFFIFFVQNSFLTKNYFLTAEIDLTVWDPFYTCLFFPLIYCSRFWSLLEVKNIRMNLNGLHVAMLVLDFKKCFELAISK